MIDDHLSLEEQNLIRRIQSMPKPKLDSVTRVAVRERMVSEFRASNFSEHPHTPSTRPRLYRQLIAAVVVVAIVVVAIGLIIAQNGGQYAHSVVETPTVTVTPRNQVAVVPSASLAPTIEGVTATAIFTPEIVPSLTPTTPPATEMASSSTPLAATQEVFITIQGPVISITDNIVSIYDFSIEVEPQHPILQVIDVGDVVRVQGVLGGDGAVVANIVSNISSATTVTAGATVGLDGPIEAINSNTLIVNGIPVQLSPDDPLLQTAQVGNFVSVQGNFVNNGTTIVLVVVNIVVINNVIVDGNPYCWYHETGMGMGMGMGHWHCDGMRMGMGMGMGS